MGGGGNLAKTTHIILNTQSITKGKKKRTASSQRSGEGACHRAWVIFCNSIKKAGGGGAKGRCR